MKIIVDAFGGDNAPLEILKGSQAAVKELGVEILLTGDEKKICDCAEKNNISLDNMEILQANDVMDMEDDPMTILKAKKGTSMAVGLIALADGKGDAFVSAGSTGALVVGSMFLVKRIKGIKRAALASVMPSDKGPVMLMDCGANVECSEKVLTQFGAMGSLYMERVIGIEKPRVGLANIGTEPTKGGALQLAAYDLMKEADYNFVGNIEARDIPAGAADVIVADGFTGNIILKMFEGVAGVLLGNIKSIFMKSFKTKMAYLLVKPGFKQFKKKMDYKEFGGAPLLGISKPVIKSHGSSDARAFKNAIRQAVQFTQQGMIDEIKRYTENSK